MKIEKIENELTSKIDFIDNAIKYRKLTPKTKRVLTNFINSCKENVTAPYILTQIADKHIKSLEVEADINFNSFANKKATASISR